MKPACNTAVSGCCTSVQRHCRAWRMLCMAAQVIHTNVSEQQHTHIQTLLRSLVVDSGTKPHERQHLHTHVHPHGSKSVDRANETANQTRCSSWCWAAEDGQPWSWAKQEVQFHPLHRHPARRRTCTAMAAAPGTPPPSAFCPARLRVSIRGSFSLAAGMVSCAAAGGRPSWAAAVAAAAAVGGCIGCGASLLVRGCARVREGARGSAMAALECSATSEGAVYSPAGMSGAIASGIAATAAALDAEGLVWQGPALRPPTLGTALLSKQAPGDPLRTRAPYLTN